MSPFDRAGVEPGIRRENGKSAEPADRPEENRSRFIALGKAALTLALVGVAGVVSAKAVYDRAAPIISEAREAIHDFSATSTVDLDAETSYAFVGAGDSLAAGMGGEQTVGTDGKAVPGSFIEPVVSILNGQKQGIAEYRYDADLVQPGLSLNELTERLRDNATGLASIPNLVLVVSAEFNTFHEAAGEMVETRGTQDPDGLAETVSSVRDAVWSAWKSLGEHDRQIREFQTVVTDIQNERGMRLQSGSGMTVIFLALPNTTQSPAVHEEMGRRGVATSDIERLQMVYNLVSRRAVNRADRESRLSGTRYVFVDPFGRAIDVSRDVSADGFHPNAHGYSKIGMLVVEQTRIVSYKGLITFMSGPEGTDTIRVKRQ